MSLPLSRQQYIDLYGPTTGDRVRLGDTELWIEVEQDLIAEASGYGKIRSRSAEGYFILASSSSC